MKAAEDFLLVVLHSHIIAAAKAILSDAEARDVVSLAKSIVDSFINLTVLSLNYVPNVSTNRVSMHAQEVLTLGLLWHNFHDSIKEGDGDRMLRCWKFNFLAFKAAKRKNYSIEALNLLLQVNYLLSPREAAQVKWCHTVNTMNHQGHNIPMDLHLEHFNRRLKSILRNMGSDVTERSVKLAAESIDVVHHVYNVFLAQSSEQKLDSVRHSYSSFEKDFKLILSVLQEQKVFISKTSRHHSSFKKLKPLFDQLKYEEILKWIKHTTNALLD